MALDFPSSPTNGQTYTANNITWVYETSTTTWKVKQDGTVGKTRVASVKDIKGNRVAGGQITANTWTTRDLNTISDPSNIGISVSTNVITIPAGTYRIKWRAPGWRIYTYQTKLEYSTSSTFASGVTKVIGSSEFCSSTSAPSATFSEGVAPSLTFSETTYVRIRQWAGVTGPTGVLNGLGVASYADVAGTNSGENNIFTVVEIEDLATTVKDNATYVEGNSRVAVLRDQKNKGVQGGDFIKDVWRDRDLTVEDDPFGFVTLYPTANGQTTPSPGNAPGYFSLPAGKYQITFTAVAHDVGKNIAAMLWSSTQSNINKTYNTTDSRDGEFYGTSMSCAGASTLSKGSEVVEISETSFFKVIHYCTSSNSGSGFGQAVDIGTPDKETYLIIEIEDLATAVKNSESINSTTNVWHVAKNDTQTIDNETWTDVSGLSQSVTSSTADTKFLITATVNCGMSANTHDALLRLMRGTTVIGSTSSDGSATTNTTGFGQVGGQTGYYNAEPLSITYLDTPGVGSHTYHIEGLNNNNASNLLVNTRGAGSFYTTSHMTIQKYTN